MFAIAREKTNRRAWVGFLLGSLAHHALWFWWGFPLARTLLPGEPAKQLVVGGGFFLVVGLAVTVCVSIALATFRGRLPLWAWFPPAWAIGERYAVQWTSVVDDWVSSQVEIAPVMRAVRWLGVVPTLLICLCLAASLGEALALRRRGSWVIALGCALVFLVAPPLQRADPALLQGIVAVHLRNANELPSLDALGEGDDLVVWPEAVLTNKPTIAEGSVRREVTLVPFVGTNIEHLVGAQIASPLGTQNALLHVTQRGDIEQARAKRVLFPVFESSFLGVGRDWLVRGSSPTLLQVAERSIIPLICGEILTRELSVEGVRAGGTVIVVAASDRFQSRLAQPSWQVLLQARLRAVELGVPVVYASLEGQASFIDADGTVLARSAMDAPSGFLRWTEARGAEDLQPPFRPSTVVLFDSNRPDLRPDCPPGRCSYLPIDAVPQAREHRATVIVSGHGNGLGIAGRSAEEVARAVAAYTPTLVVLDACFASSTPLLAALAKQTDAVIVAAPSLIEGSGLVYDPSVFGEGSPTERALGVNTDPPSRLFVGRPSVEAIASLEATVAQAPADELRRDVRTFSAQATLVERALPDGQKVLVPVPWQTIGSPPAPRPSSDERVVPRFHVRALWLPGADASDRPEVDAFLRCLHEGSTFADFFRGKARITFDGSWQVGRPAEVVHAQNRTHVLEALIRDLPPVPDGVTPLYLVFGAAAELPLQSACGYHDLGTVNHQAAVLALVRTSPPCWAGAPSLRSETQIAMHEIAEGVDLALGHRGCVANGRCEGGGGCDRPCDGFTGLFCPGAPEATPTGCGDGIVRGWVVQRLAHKGWDEDDDCPPCAACDFTVEATPRPATP
jgi:apolipoprotein N-acyltransferase